MKKYFTKKTLILIFSICGLILSAGLWYYKYINKMPICTFSGCEHVLTGSYSEIFITPVATYGFFYYAFLILLSFQRIFIKDKLIKILFTIFLIIGWIFTLYLRALELLKLHNWCEWCWMSVLFMALITIFFVFDERKVKTKDPKK